ncbi:hypothetical protein [Thermasporomyces composti]|jgi:hypothetical protein|uniref:Uncharacterized protein n=1 Tax=Thermasporomyces composti TaxID=696763 RepID=A0A3D9V8Y3_THECX|nr:hypothetical protein [Thermasporomyces composti]REF35455.1 hypothetical protein DFJ64_0835 [Thermasporomyces composti]
MRDVQKGRKSWLERLTSPPESDSDDNLQNEPHPFERTLENGPHLPPRDARFPEGYEAFAPPGLRPPPSEDLKSTPPERERDRERPHDRPHDVPGPGFDAGAGTFDGGPGSGPHHGGSPHGNGAGPFEPKSDDRPASPASGRDAWDAPTVTTPRAEESSNGVDSTALSSSSSSNAATSTSLSWQPEPSADDAETNRSSNGSQPELLIQEEEEPSGPSEAEQLEAARRRHIEELQHRWLVTQAQLLDDPRDAVREAGLLIGDAMQFVTSTFSEHRDRIEREWKNNENLSTDELRMIMRRYRNLFQYVLSASQLPDL